MANPKEDPGFCNPAHLKAIKPEPIELKKPEGVIDDRIGRIRSPIVLGVRYTLK